MGRLLTWLGGALGLAALWRFLRQEQQGQRRAPEPPERDPAAELRAKLEQARGSADDRDDYDAAEGQPVDQVGARSTTVAEPPADPEPRSLEDRRRAIHEKAQQALGEMQRPPDE